MVLIGDWLWKKTMMSYHYKVIAINEFYIEELNYVARSTLVTSAEATVKVCFTLINFYPSNTRLHI